jgi:hypothetical protein
MAVGVVNTALGLVVTGGHLPAVTHLGGALLLGSLSYRVSVVLDAHALRMVGAAREAAYFATAPLAGVLVAVTILGNPLHWYNVMAMGAMGLGVAPLVRERHDHFHEHEAIEHELERIYDGLSTLGIGGCLRLFARAEHVHGGHSHRSTAAEPARTVRSPTARCMGRRTRPIHRITRSNRVGCCRPREQPLFVRRHNHTR